MRRRFWPALGACFLMACGGPSEAPDAVPSEVCVVDLAGDPAVDPAGPDIADALPTDVAEIGPETVAPDAVVQVQTPTSVKPGEPFPVIVRVLAADGRPDRQASGAVALDDATHGGTLCEIVLRHGVGSAQVRVSTEGQLVLRAKVGASVGDRSVTVASVAAPITLAGELSGEDLAWPDAADVRLTGDTTVPAGSTLRIGAGTRVRLAARANLFVTGRLEASGTVAAPVWITADGDEPWGGVVHDGGGDYAHVLFTRGGGDTARAFGHSKSQPVLLVDQAAVTLVGGAFVDNVGKGPSGTKATYTLDQGLVTRCDTGGEWESSAVTVRDTWVLEIPNADGQFVDDDNDGIYLHLSLPGPDGEPVPSTIERSVFAVGKDDGIDQNGATLIVRDVILEGFAHEGLATSNKGRVEATSVLATRCEQGFEVGYSDPGADPLHLVLDHVVAIDNDVGLRLGDSYDRVVTGTLTVTNSIATGNRLHNVWNHVNKLNGPLDGHVSIATSMVDDPEWDGRNGNLPGTPVFDVTWHLVPGTTGTGAASDGSDLGLLP